MWDNVKEYMQLIELQNRAILLNQENYFFTREITSYLSVRIGVHDKFCETTIE